MKKTIYSLLTVLMACTSKLAKDNPILIEANKIHLEASKIQEEIEPQIMKLDSLKALLIAKNTPTTDSVANTLDQLKTDFEDWEKNLFEVPGFEHPHKEGKHHHHEHSPSPEIPDDKMLEIQKEIKADIEKIKEDLKVKITEINKLLKE